MLTGADSIADLDLLGGRRRGQGAAGARPLLSLFAAEMFMAAETVALRKPGQRLPVPFIAVLDELRYGVTVPNLPYVASSQRKYGIGFVYSVQSSGQEEAVYGKDAAALRDAAGVTIISVR